MATPPEAGWRARAGATQAAAEVPPDPPLMPVGLLPLVAEALVDTDAPWATHLGRSVRLVWLEPEDSRLGVTRFEEPSHELVRRRRLKLAPGDVEVGLHPILDRDPVLLRHTLAHELLHAAGLVHHDARHSALVDRIAPAPRLADSVVLQELREDVLARQTVQAWTCVHCGHGWERRRVRRPGRCPKCAKPLA